MEQVTLCRLAALLKMDSAEKCSESFSEQLSFITPTECFI